MDSKRGRKRKNVEGDRLSALPDDLIHKILSFVDMREAIGTSAFSSRWRFIWTSMPYLTFSTDDFPTIRKFSKFATKVLSHRNNLTEVYSMELCFRGKVTQGFVKRLLNYAFSHNIQQLNVIYFAGGSEKEFPLSLFISESVKHISLKTQYDRFSGHNIYSYLTSTWELPMLTTLDLHCVTLCDDEADKCVGVFLKCANLTNLTLKWFGAKGSDGFSIVHPRLLNLTLENCYRVNVVTLTTPQLKNLTIRSCRSEIVITAPALACLLLKSDYYYRLSSDGFHSLEKADICISAPQSKDAQEIVFLLQQIQNVCFLTLSLEIVEILSSSVDLILQQPSPFVNLKSLKIYPNSVDFYGRTLKVISTKLKSYLLDSSLDSAFTMVFREEIKAHKIMAELGVILKKEKVQLESHEPKSIKIQNIGGNVAPIKNSRWKNPRVQIEKASCIVSKLRSIEELVTKLPAPNIAKIQPCYSSLCVEADITISQITERMKRWLSK